MSSVETRNNAEIDLAVHDLGRMPYADVFQLQKGLQQKVIEARRQVPSLGYLVLVEHDPPVITISRRKTARNHLLANDEQLASAGVQLTQTDRGGDITYHGPGQLVVYPILDLNALRLRIHSYMRCLEQIVIDTLAEFAIEGRRDECATGVWVGDDPQKICAMGVRVSRWVSMHGLALNVTTNLDHFNLIVPCGLVGRTVTSIHKQLDDACPTMDQVKLSLISRFRNAIDRTTT